MNKVISIFIALAHDCSIHPNRIDSSLDHPLSTEGLIGIDRLTRDVHFSRRHHPANVHDSERPGLGPPAHKRLHNPRVPSRAHAL